MPSFELAGQTVTFEQSGAGEPVLFVHGSFATSSAWRRIVAEMDGEQFRSIAVDLPGCGGSSEPAAERCLLEQEVEAVESLAAHAVGAPVHLVGHSYGGALCLAVAIAGRVPLRSLTLFEPLPLTLLAASGDTEALGEMLRFVDEYRSAFEAGDAHACSRVVDLWGGEGTYASMPKAVRKAMAPATAANIRQWVDNLAFRPTLDAYRGVSVPVTIIVGEHAHPTSRLMSRRLAELMARSSFVEIEGAGHFMIHSHAARCAGLVGGARPRVSSWPAAAPGP